MKTRVQIAAALISFASLVGFAAMAPTASTTETQSFIGTAPNATTVEALPATF